MQPIFQREVPVPWPSGMRIVRRVLLGAAIGFCTAGAVAAIRPARVYRTFTTGKADLARFVVKKYAFEAFPSWVAMNPDRACPRSLRELDPYMGHHEAKDPFGNAYYFACGEHALPKGVRGMWVVSAGEDGVFGTADDARSDR
jgi:hypothetical protein